MIKNNDLVLILILIFISEIKAYGSRERCPSCSALEKCETVVCHTYLRNGKKIPTTAPDCVLVCSDQEIICRRTFNGIFQWDSFNPCAIPSTTTTTTTTSPSTTDRPSTFSKTTQYPTTPSRRVRTFFPMENLKMTTSLLKGVEESQRKRQEPTYGLSWLVSEPELEIILWIMFSGALFLLFLGILGIFIFLWYRKRLKKQLKLQPSNRPNKDSRSRAYGIVAYETAPFEDGIEYSKLMHTSEYWIQNHGYHSKPSLTSNPHLHFFQKYGTCQRRLSNFSTLDEEPNYPDRQVLQTAYGSSSDGDAYTPVVNPSCQLMNFTTSLDTPTMDSVRLRDPELIRDYIGEVPFLPSTCSEPLSECFEICRPLPPNLECQMNYSMSGHSTDPGSYHTTNSFKDMKI